MTPEQFCYWLQGKLEDRDEKLSDEEIDSIREHLKLVFTKVTPVKESFPTSPSPYPWPSITPQPVWIWEDPYTKFRPPYEITCTTGSLNTTTQPIFIC